MADPKTPDAKNAGLSGLLMVVVAVLATIGAALSGFGTLGILGAGIAALGGGAILSSLAQGQGIGGMFEAMNSGIHGMFNSVTKNLFGFETPTTAEMMGVGEGSGTSLTNGLLGIGGGSLATGFVAKGINKWRYKNAQAKFDEVVDILKKDLEKMNAGDIEILESAQKDKKVQKLIADAETKKGWWPWAKKAAHPDMGKQIEKTIQAHKTAEIVATKHADAKQAAAPDAKQKVGARRNNSEAGEGNARGDKAAKNPKIYPPEVASDMETPEDHARAERLRESGERFNLSDADLAKIEKAGENMRTAGNASAERTTSTPTETPEINTKDAHRQNEPVEVAIAEAGTKSQSGKGAKPAARQPSGKQENMPRSAQSQPVEPITPRTSKDGLVSTQETPTARANTQSQNPKVKPASGINEMPIARGHTSPNKITTGAAMPAAGIGFGLQRVTQEGVANKVIGSGEIAASALDALAVAKKIKGAGIAGTVITSADGIYQVSTSYDSNATAGENALNMADKTVGVGTNIGTNLVTGFFAGAESPQILWDASKQTYNDGFQLARKVLGKATGANEASYKEIHDDYTHIIHNQLYAYEDALVQSNPVQYVASNLEIVALHGKEYARFRADDETLENLKEMAGASRIELFDEQGHIQEANIASLKDYINARMAKESGKMSWHNSSLVSGLKNLVSLGTWGDPTHYNNAYQNHLTCKHALKELEHLEQECANIKSQTVGLVQVPQTPQAPVAPRSQSTQPSL